MGDNDPDMYLVYRNFGRRKRPLSQKTIEQRLAKEKREREEREKFERGFIGRSLKRRFDDD
jgi:hypothetical protein